jgi:hypothetical protein
MWNSVTAEFCVDGIPCRWKSMSTEFRVDGILYSLNAVSTGEFRVNRGILCQWGNSMSTGELRVDGIPSKRNSVDTKLYILLKSLFLMKQY